MTVTGGASPVVRCRTLLVVRVGQRARIGGGTDGSARIGSAILYGVRAVTAWNLKPMGYCSNCEWIGRHGLAWPGAHACTRSHQHAGTSAHARRHTHAHAGQRCWSQCRWGVRPGAYAQTCEAFGLPGGHECDPTQRWHQTKVPKSWTNWTCHCRVFRATLGVHRDVHGRARLGGGRSPRSEPGAHELLDPSVRPFNPSPDLKFNLKR